MAAFLGQGGIAAIERLGLGDLAAELLLPRQKIDHLARAARGVHQAVARGAQFPHHLDQRDAVQPDGQVVEQRRGLGVAQDGKLLKLVQPDGEDVVEDRLIDAAEQRLEQRLAVPGAVGRKDQEFVGILQGDSPVFVERKLGQSPFC